MSKQVSPYRLRDEKLRDDIIKLVLKHSKDQDLTKVLTGLRLKFKELRGTKPNQKSTFELEAITMEWKHAKGPYKRKPHGKEGN